MQHCIGLGMHRYPPTAYFHDTFPSVAGDGDDDDQETTTGDTSKRGTLEMYEQFQKVRGV